MRLSIVIPCYNSAVTIRRQLEALVSQSWNESWEVIVADNGSTDRTLDMVRGYENRLENFRVVNASSGRGSAYARNRGAEAARGDALAFIDADDEVAPGWLRLMGEALLRHEFVACRVDTSKLNPPWVIKTRSGQAVTELKRLPYPPYMPQAGGGTLGIRKSVHDAIGGFDESLERLMDVDYCIRAQLHGVKLHFVPEAVVHIQLRDSFTGLFWQARLWGEYNVLMYKRYRPPDIRLADPWKRHARQWASLLVGIRTLRSRDECALWVWRLGWQIGRLQGSLKHKVCPV